MRVHSSIALNTAKKIVIHTRAIKLFSLAALGILCVSLTLSVAPASAGSGGGIDINPNPNPGAGSGAAEPFTADWTTLNLANGTQRRVRTALDGASTFSVGSEQDPQFGKSDFRVTKLKADGKYDTTFGQYELNSGFTTVLGSGKTRTRFRDGACSVVDAAAHDVITLPGGDLIAVGTVKYSGRSMFAVARYNANGTLDTQFVGSENAGGNKYPNLANKCGDWETKYKGGLVATDVGAYGGFTIANSVATSATLIQNEEGAENSHDLLVAGYIDTEGANPNTIVRLYVVARYDLVTGKMIDDFVPDIQNQGGVSGPWGIDHNDGPNIESYTLPHAGTDTVTPVQVVAYNGSYTVGTTGESVSTGKRKFAFIRFYSNGDKLTSGNEEAKGFGTDGIVMRELGNTGQAELQDLILNKVASGQQGSDDKFLIAVGHAKVSAPIGTKTKFAMTKLNSETGSAISAFGNYGTALTSFGTISATSSIFTPDLSADYATTVTQTKDIGDLVAAGYTSSGGKTKFAVARYNFYNGKLEAGWGQKPSATATYRSGRVILPATSDDDRAYGITSVEDPGGEYTDLVVGGNIQGGNLNTTVTVKLDGHLGEYTQVEDCYLTDTCNQQQQGQGSGDSGQQQQQQAVTTTSSQRKPNPDPYAPVAKINAPKCPKAKKKAKACASKIRTWKKVTGTVTDKKPSLGITKVEINIVLKQGRKCFGYLSGRFKKLSSCNSAKKLWVATKLKKKSPTSGSWSINLKNLKRGSYELRARASDKNGNVQKSFKANISSRKFQLKRK